MTTSPPRTGPSVLHICSDFPNQHIYQELVRSLRARGQTQFVFSAVRTAQEVGKQPPDQAPELRFSFQKVLRPYHKYLFRTKIRTAHRALCSVVDPSEFGVVHAHYLYSDGALALRLKRERNIPFMTAVRGTDVYGFMRLRPDLWPIAKRILTEASAVVFLSPAYRDAVFARIGAAMTRVIQGKVLINPSGVPQSWLDNPPPSRPHDPKLLRVLYIGDFSRNKNIPAILRAVESIRATTPATITLVGGGGDGETLVDAMVREPRYSFVQRHQPIRDPEKLREIYRAHDVFVMPSFLETFGIVYLEALSQGLPIVHTRGQGVDGLFENGTVSESVDPRQDQDIAAAIVRAAQRRTAVAAECVRQAARFSWGSVSQRYVEAYDKIRAGLPAVGAG